MFSAADRAGLLRIKQRDRPRLAWSQLNKRACGPVAPSSSTTQEYLPCAPKQASQLPPAREAPIKLNMTKLQELYSLRASRQRVEDELQMLRAQQNKNIQRELDQAFASGARKVYDHWKSTVSLQLADELYTAGCGQNVYEVLKQSTAMYVDDYDTLKTRRIPEMRG